MSRVSSVRASVAIGLAAHLGITVFLASSLSLWIDEAYTLETTGHGIGHAFRQALGFEMQPPLYYVLVAAWRSISPGLFFCRLFSVLCVALAICFMALAVRRSLPRVHPGFVVLAMAFNPAAVWAATEARPYALGILIATLLVLLFTSGFLREGARRDRIAFTGVAILGLYTQYYLGFLLVAGGAALLALRRWRPLRDYLGFMLVVFACLLPLLTVVPEQVSANAGMAGPPALRDVLNFTLAGFEDLLTAASSLGGGRAGRWLFRGALAAVILVSCFQARGRRRTFLDEVAAPLVISSVVLGFFVVVQLALGADSGAWRYMAFVLPAGLLLLYGLAAGGPVWPVAVLTLLLTSSGGWALHSRFGSLAKHGDHARVGAFLTEADARGEAIYVFPGEQVLALNHYYEGRGEIHAVPAPPSTSRYDPSRNAWRSREQVEEAFQGVGTGETCWLVTYGIEQQVGVPLRSDWLESVVASDFRVVESPPFHAGAVVRGLRRRADPAAGLVERP